ncbi:MAG: metallophosphoesterase, partial [Victivallales bacterium]|nr:metallophosphoesterase [Victivallales bacterium]
MLKLCVCEIVVVVLFVASFAVSAADSGDELVFCVTGDSRGDFKNTKINKPILEKLVVALKKENPSFVLFSGDLVSGYSPELEKQLTEWRDVFMAPLLDAGVRVYPCRGNHESSQGHFVANSKVEAFKNWGKVFFGKYALPANGPDGEKGVTYFVKEKNVLAVVLDNYAKGRKHKVNLGWMKEVLAANMNKNGARTHLFVLCHEPAFSVLHKDCMQSHPTDRDAFVKLFMNNGGVAFFCGHDHFFNHAKVLYPTGVFHQFVCG